MADIRTPQGSGDDSGDDPRLIEALRALGRTESSRPDELTRHRHLRAMSRARVARRPYRAVAAAAAVVALIAGAAVVGSGGSGSSNNNDLARNAALPSDSSLPAALPEFPAESEITPVPFERTEEHVILKVSQDQAAAIEAELATSLGGKVPVVGKTSKSTTFVVPASVAKKISDTTGISAYPDSPVAAVAEQSPVPSWGLDRIDALDTPFDEKYSWSNAGTGSIVYVIDTGVYSGHADLSGRVVSGYTAVADGNGTQDCHGHGTHVAGTVAGSQYGVAKSSTVVAVRVLDCNGSGYTSGVVAGINWVVANHPGGPGIINMSLGGPANTALDAAVSDATAAGLVVAVAAGNSSDDACAYSPARAPSALTIGATDNTDARAYYSNTGSCVDMWAPGSQITSAWIGGSGASRTISGTSMASPHVAGLAARLLSMNPSLSISDIRSRLVKKNSTATTPIVNLVEEPADTPVTTTTAPATTVPESTTTIVDSPTTTEPVATTTVPEPVTTTTVKPAPTTTTIPGVTTTTVPPSTLPKRGRSDEAPGRTRKVTQPKQFQLGWETNGTISSLVASWAVETAPDRYTMECEGIGRKAEDTTLEFEQSAVTVSPNGRSQTTLLIAPKAASKCNLTALIGNDKSRESNTAVIPPTPRRPVVTTTTTPVVTTTTTPVVTTTIPAPDTTTTVPTPDTTTPAPTTIPEATTTVPGSTTTIAPAGGRPSPATTVKPSPASTVTTVKPSPATTVKPSPTTTIKQTPAPKKKP